MLRLFRGLFKKAQSNEILTKLKELSGKSDGMLPLKLMAIVISNAQKSYGLKNPPAVNIGIIETSANVAGVGEEYKTFVEEPLKDIILKMKDPTNLTDESYTEFADTIDKVSEDFTNVWKEVRESAPEAGPTKKKKSPPKEKSVVPDDLIKILITKESLGKLQDESVDAMYEAVQNLPAVKTMLAKVKSEGDSIDKLYNTFQLAGKAMIDNFFKDSAATSLASIIGDNRDELTAEIKEGMTGDNAKFRTGSPEIIREITRPLLASLVAEYCLGSFDQQINTLINPSGAEEGVDDERITAITSENSDQYITQILDREQQSVRALKEQLAMSEESDAPTFYFASADRIIFTTEGRKLLLSIWKERMYGSTGEVIVGLFQSRVRRIQEESTGEAPQETSEEQSGLEKGLFDRLAKSISIINVKHDYVALIPSEVKMVEFLVGLGLGDYNVPKFSIVAYKEGTGESHFKDIGVHNAIVFLGSNGILPRVVPVTASAKWEYTVNAPINLSMAAKSSAEQGWFFLLLQFIMNSNSKGLHWLQQAIALWDERFEAYRDVPASKMLDMADKTLGTAKDIISSGGAKGGPGAPVGGDVPLPTQKGVPFEPSPFTGEARFTLRSLKRLAAEAKEKTRNKYYTADDIVRAVCTELKASKNKAIDVDISWTYDDGNIDSFVLFSVTLHNVKFNTPLQYKFDLGDDDVKKELQNPKKLLSLGSLEKHRIGNTDMFLIENSTSYASRSMTSYASVLVPFTKVFKQVDAELDPRAFIPRHETEVVKLSAGAEVYDRTDKAVEKEETDKVVSSGRDLMSLINNTLNTRLIVPGFDKSLNKTVKDLKESDNLDQLAGSLEMELVYAPLVLLKNKLAKNLRNTTPEMQAKVTAYTVQLRKFITEVSALATKTTACMFDYDKYSDKDIKAQHDRYIGNTFNEALDAVSGLQSSSASIISDTVNTDQVTYTYTGTAEKDSTAVKQSNLVNKIQRSSDFFRNAYEVSQVELDNLQAKILLSFNNDLVDGVTKLKKKIIGPALTPQDVVRSKKKFIELNKEVEKAKELVYSTDGLPIEALKAKYASLAKMIGTMVTVDPTTGETTNPAVKALNNLNNIASKDTSKVQAAFFVMELDDLAERLNDLESDAPIEAYDKEFKRIYNSMKNTTGTPPKELVVDQSQQRSIEALQGIGDSMDGLISATQFYNPEGIKRTLNYADKTLDMSADMAKPIINVPRIPTAGSKDVSEAMQKYATAMEFAKRIPMKGEIIDTVKDLIAHGVGIIVNAVDESVNEPALPTMDRSRKVQDKMTSSDVWAKNIAAKGISTWVTEMKNYLRENIDDIEDTVGPEDMEAFKSVLLLNSNVLKLLTDLELGNATVSDVVHNKDINDLLDLIWNENTRTSEVGEQQHSDWRKYVKETAKGIEDNRKRQTEEKENRIEMFKQYRMEQLKKKFAGTGMDTERFFNATLSDAMYREHAFMLSKADKFGISLDKSLPTEQLHKNYATVKELLDKEPSYQTKFDIEKVVRSWVKDNPGLPYNEAVSMLQNIYGVERGFSQEQFARVKDPNWSVKYLDSMKDHPYAK